MHGDGITDSSHGRPHSGKTSSRIGVMRDLIQVSHVRDRCDTSGKTLSRIGVIHQERHCHG